MEQGRSMDTRHGIADTLISGASLLVGYLPYGISLTSPTALATLAEDGPTRLTALAAGTGVSQPAMTQCAGRMERDDLAVRLIDPEGARDTGRCHRRRAGTALCKELLESIRDRLAELLATLSPQGEATLGMAMRVALPLVEQLTREAAQQPRSLPPSAR